MCVPYLAKGEENVANPLGSPKTSPEWFWFFLRPKACGYFNPLSRGEDAYFRNDP